MKNKAGLRDRGDRVAVPSRPPRRTFAIVAAALLVAAAAGFAHGPVLRAQALSLDDDAFVTHNPLVMHPSWASARRFFVEMLEPSTVPGYYVPLTMTSLMLDVARGGRPDDLRAFHVTQLALHLIGVALVVLILFRLFGSPVPAALAGLLFGLHPLTVEPIAWIGERKTLLAACLAWASIAAWIESVRARPHGSGRATASTAWRVAAVAAYALALLSKPTVLMLPLLLLVLDAWPLRRRGRAAVIEKWPFFLLSIASGAVTLVSHARTAEILPVSAGDLVWWPLRAAYLLGFYVQKMAWPAHLTPVYAPPVPLALANPDVLLGVAIAVATTIAVLFVARRHKAPAAAWTFFVVAIAPTLGAVKYSWVIASDKYVYFPALGIAIALCAGIDRLWAGSRAASGAEGSAGAGAAPVGDADAGWRRTRTARRWVLVVVAVFAIAEFQGTRTALRPWRTSLELFRHMAVLAPDAPMVQDQLGVLYAQAADLDAALAHLRRAVALAPNFAKARYNLGVALASADRAEEAVPQFRRAQALLPDNADVAFNLALALRRAGRNAEADEWLSRARALRAAQSAESR